MCKQCDVYGKNFVITAPISDTEKYIWSKYGYHWFMFWHKFAWFDRQPAKDRNGNYKMAS